MGQRRNFHYLMLFRIKIHRTKEENLQVNQPHMICTVIDSITSICSNECSTPIKQERVIRISKQVTYRISGRESAALADAAVVDVHLWLLERSVAARTPELRWYAVGGRTFSLRVPRQMVSDRSSRLRKTLGRDSGEKHWLAWQGAASNFDERGVQLNGFWFGWITSVALHWDVGMLVNCVLWGGVLFWLCRIRCIYLVDDRDVPAPHSDMPIETPLRSVACELRDPWVCGRASRETRSRRRWSEECEYQNAENNRTVQRITRGTHDYWKVDLLKWCSTNILI